MTITITGGKYANNTIASVGTTTVTATTANFVSADFSSTQRIVGMWNSGGTTFLGMAFVRAFVSTSQLQLETAFYDPATGATVAQTAGNVIIVSKNFADSATTNLTVANNVVTQTDFLVFGSSTTVATSVCFFDQDVTLISNFAAASGQIVQINGGLVVWGKLESYANNTVSNPVNMVMTSLIPTGGGTYNLGGVVSGSTLANFAMYGGSLISNTGYPMFSAGNANVTPYTWVQNSVQCGVTMISPSSGGSWVTNQTRIQLINCFSEFTLGSTCARLWGDGIQIGGSFKFPYGDSVSYGCFGNYGVSGNYFYGGTPGNRTIVLDLGGIGWIGWTGEGNPATWYVTNFIASSYNFGPGAASSSYVLNQYFQDTITFSSPAWLNLNTTGLTSTTSNTVGPICSFISGQAAIISGNSFVANQPVVFSATVGTSGGQVVAGTTYYVSATGLSNSQFQVSASPGGASITFNAAGVATCSNAAIASSSSPSLLYQVVSGTTQTTAPPSAWYWGAKAYGKIAASGTITATTYATSSGNGPQVSFGQAVNFLPDTGVGSVTQSVANAYTSISTLDQLYAASSNWSTLTQANATYPNISTFPITFSGSQLNLGNLNLVLATSGSAFSINTSTNTLTINCTTLATGTIFTSFTTTGTVTLGSSTINTPYTCSTGSQGELTLTNLTSGSSIYIATSGGAQIAYVPSSGTSYTIFIPPNTGSNYVWKVVKYGMLPNTGTFNPQTVSSVIVVQVTDPYITQTTVATVAAYTSLNSPDQIYDYAAYYETQSTGISFTRLTTGSGKVLSFGSSTVTFSSGASSVYVISGTTVTIKTATTFVNGTTFSSGFSTSGTFTNTGSTTTIKCLYVTSVGTSLAITLTVPIGAAVAIVSGSTVVQYTSSATNTTGIVSYYAAPGQTGSWFYRVAQYQFLSSYLSFTPSGQITNTVTLSPDTGITNTSVSAVAAYTVLTTCDQFYDYAAYWQTTNGTGGIFVPNLITKNGSQISLAGMALTFTNGTGTPLTVTVTSGAMTAITVQTGGTFATGTTFTNFATTSTTTLTSTTITCVYTNSSGTSTVISVGNLPYTAANGGTYLSLVTNTGAQAQYIGPVTSGSQKVYIAPGAALSYSLTIACYGFISAPYPFTTQGYVTITGSLATDTGITQPTRATVAAYAALTNCDQFYDYAAYWQTTNNTGGITVTNLIVKNGAQVSVGAIALTFTNGTGTPLAATITSGSVTALTIQTGGTFATGPTTFTNFATTSTTTLTSTTITCVYQNSSGISTVLTVSNLPYTAANGGSYLSLINNSSVQVQYIGPVTTGSQVIYIAPGGALSYSVKIACYGYIAATSSFTTQGYVSVVASLSGDTGITQTTRATAGGYTLFTSPDQIYDYLAYFETTNGTGGITVTRPASKNGNIVAFGTNNIVFNATASSVYTYASGSPNTLTFKVSTLVVGVTFTQFSTSGTVTLSNGSVVNLQYFYATGVQVPIVISNLIVGSNYGVVVSSTGTVITSGTAASSTVTYYYQWTANVSVYVRVRYYGATKYLPFETIGTITNSGLSINANQVSDSIGN